MVPASPPPPPPPPPPPINIAAAAAVGFAIGARCGTGQFGAVYAALDARSGLPCAIKVVNKRLAADAGMLARLVREKNLLVRMHHEGACPFVVKIVAVCQDNFNL